MRRCAILERIQQEAELLLLLGFRDPEDAEYRLLHVAAVDTHRATTDFIV